MEHFDSVSGKEDWSPRYNVAPTQLVTVWLYSKCLTVAEVTMLLLDSEFSDDASGMTRNASGYIKCRSSARSPLATQDTRDA
jgi:hypothetical protein